MLNRVLRILYTDGMITCKWLITFINKGKEVYNVIDKNSQKVIDLIKKYDNLSKIDKIRLAIYLLENKNFNVRDITILLKQVLGVIDTNNTKVMSLVLFFSVKYL